MPNIKDSEVCLILMVKYFKSKTAQQLIKKLALLHKTELELNWTKAVQGKQIDRIKPLD